MRPIALVALCAVLASGQELRTYVSSDKSFQLLIPSEYRVYDGPNVSRGGNSYIPVCHEDIAVCIVYQGSKYRGTNFESAAIEEIGRAHV